MTQVRDLATAAVIVLAFTWVVGLLVLADSAALTIGSAVFLGLGFLAGYFVTATRFARFPALLIALPLAIFSPALFIYGGMAFGIGLAAWLLGVLALGFSAGRLARRQVAFSPSDYKP